MTTDEQAIGDLISLWTKATIEGDLNRLVSLMAQDVVFLTPGRPPMGLNDFMEGFTQNLERGKIVPVTEISEIHIAGELAYTCCQLSVTFTPFKEDQSTVRSGHTLSIFRKQANGEWVLIRDANLLTQVTARA